MTRDPNLLSEIEQDVLDSGKPLPDVLRKCMVLGGKTGSVELREWAVRELKRYGQDDDLPEYRRPVRSLPSTAFGGNT